MRWVFFLSGCLGVSASANATVITFQQGVTPTAAYAHLGQDIRGNNSANTGSDTLVGEQVGGVLQLRTVLAFDLSAIPSGAHINSIALLMTVNNTGNGSPAGLGAIEIHEVIPNGVASNDMVENQVAWGSWKTGSAWTTAGGDFGSTLTSGTVTDSNSNSAFDNGEAASFASSVPFVTAAQNSFDAGRPLELILLSPTAEAAASTNFARFGSDDATSASNRPLLTVDYTAPEPATSGMLLTAAAGLLLRRRSRFAGRPSIQ